MWLLQILEYWGCCWVVSKLGYFVAAKITLFAYAVVIIVPNSPELCLVLASAVSDNRILERYSHYVKVFIEGSFTFPEVRMLAATRGDLAYHSLCEECSFKSDPVWPGLLSSRCSISPEIVKSIILESWRLVSTL